MIMAKWAWIKGYEGKYKISDSGRVVSYATGKPYELSRNRLNADGYIHLSLRKDNKAHEYLLNRLVALTFIGNPLHEDDTVNHINGIKTDNRVANLEWATRSEQMYHAYRMKLKKPVKEKEILRFTDEQKKYICNNYKPYKHGFSINAFAKKFNVCHGTIEQILIEGGKRNV